MEAGEIDRGGQPGGAAADDQAVENGFVHERPNALVMRRFRARRRDDLPRHRPDPLPGDVSGAAWREPCRAGARARASGASRPANIRDFATDKHRSVDDTPAGGGAGMVLRPDVLAAALDSVADGRPMLALTPRGAPLTQARVRELAAGEGVILLCGRFEGFDERIFEARAARTGLDRRLCAVRRRARRDGHPRCLREAASRGNGRGLQRRGGELRTTGFSNIRTIPGLLNGKGARSPKCCDRGIMRRSRRGDMTKRSKIHG